MASPQEKQQYSRNKLVASLLQIKHPEKSKVKGARAEDNVKKLELYVPTGLAAAKADPDLIAHFVAWNQINGKIRDAQVALPVIALRGLTKKDQDLAENAVANLMQLSPRDLERAYDFSKLLTKQGYHIPGDGRSWLERGIKRYLEMREDNTKWWDRTVLQFRDSMKSLYRLSHRKPTPRVQSILFESEYPAGSVFARVAALKDLPARDAAGVILTYKIPFEVAVGAVNKAHDKDIVLALLEGMSGNQVITNTQMLEKFGVMKEPALKAAYEAAIKRAKADKKTETLKAGRAAKQTQNKEVAAQLDAVQVAQTAKLGTIEGDWLVLGDRSGSMHVSIEVARKVAGLIAERVAGSVHLIFFDTSPLVFDVTGKSYEQIVEETRRVGPGGSTSIGCGLDYIRSRGILVNAIAVVSDGGENAHPIFAEVYKKYCAAQGIEPPVYLFHVPGDHNVFTRNCGSVGIQVEEFELGSDVDYYSLPNIVKTLRANRYALYDEIMATPLLTFAAVAGRREA